MRSGTSIESSPVEASIPTQSSGPSFNTWLSKFPPAYFALVMATGILAVACQLLGIPVLPRVLAGFNVVAYVILWFLTILRFLLHRSQFLADFSSHQRGPGFFTAVAATAVVGVQYSVLDHAVTAPRVLWGVAFVLWLLLTYAIFTALTIREEKPSLVDGLNGGWLTAVVATQSLVVLGCNSGLSLDGDQEVVALGLVSLWLAGGMLYTWMISLIFYRYTFLKFAPSDLMPPYWINMGAMAISTLAGALLIKLAPSSPLLTSLAPFLRGFMLLYWATATWWIPMLVVLGVWRHITRRVPLVYDPLYWGMVFPLAMYTTATYRVGQVLDQPHLFVVSRFFVGIAISAWTMTMLGLIVDLALAALRRPVPVEALPARAEWGRRRIFAGWVAVMFGAIGWCELLGAADGGAGLVSPLTHVSLAGVGSGALLALGIVVWLGGYLGYQRNS